MGAVVGNGVFRVRRICLVGAGVIAHTHAEALRAVPGVRVASVVDPNAAAARRFAAAWSIPQVFPSAEEAIAAGEVDAAHVLVPPDVHARAALPFLQAGLPVLVEKPLAANSAECAALLDAAAAGAATAVLGVNQNFVHHPAFVRLRRMVEQRRLGRPVSVSCTYNVPLRQLEARQFGHWMFRAPGNILLEQAVHPLSQVVALAGPPGDVSALAGTPVKISPGVRFFPSADVLLGCAKLPAQIRFAVGAAFPVWTVSVVCDDGVAVADILANRTYAHARTRWLPVVDGLLSGAGMAGSILGSEVRNASDYGLSTLRLKRRSDPFFRSMHGSIAAFHAALDRKTAPELDGQFGAMMVSVCERIRDTAFGVDTPGSLAEPPPAERPAAAQLPSARPGPRSPGSVRPDVTVLGGTGFIGTQVVKGFLAEGRRVAVMARSVRNLPALFGNEGVMLHQGSIRDEAASARAIEGSPTVVNLAHGGGGDTFEQVRDAMVGGAETVARLCAAQAGTRLIHIGSIASLYLGPQRGAVTGETPPDPHADQRADYARAKAMADHALLDMHRDGGLPVCILRPGLVVGEGTSPFHSGLGFFNNDQHCIGWNRGRNPLPWVLVEDVAAAIVLAASRMDDNQPGGQAGAAGLAGRCFNLVGDVRPTAREYIADLAQALERPLRFHPKLPDALWLEELGKWAIKRAGGRSVPLPSKRDILSRGLRARFDCSDAQRALGWQPVADPKLFHERAILVHAH